MDARKNLYRFAASRTYDLAPALAGIEPHPQQGFHLRLTVHAVGSQGADTKFKEYWVGPCGETPPTTAPPTTGGPPTTPIEPGSGPGTPPGTPPGGGPGVTLTPSASTATSATGTLPDTGSNALPLVAAGLPLAGLGSGIVLAARTRRSPSQ
jgi:LPXTG-motif cell wall-anchored protein